MALTPAALPFLSPPASTASWGVPYDFLTDGDSSLSTDRLPDKQALPEMALALLLWGMAQGQQWRESLSVDRLGAVHLAVHYAWKKKWPDTRL